MRRDQPNVRPYFRAGFFGQERNVLSVFARPLSGEEESLTHSKTAYKCISTGLSFLAPGDEPTYDVFVGVLSYGKHAGLGNPPVDLDPNVRGLLKDDAIFWALGQAQVILKSGDWQIAKQDLDGDKTTHGIWLEDKLGARYEILIAEVSERATREHLRRNPPHP